MTIDQEHPLLTLVKAIGRYVEQLPDQHPEWPEIYDSLQRRLTTTSVTDLSKAPAHPRQEEMTLAFDCAREQGAYALIDALLAANHYLTWTGYDSYPAAEIGSDFPRRHLFASLIETVDPGCTHDVDFGLFWIDAHTLYRDHSHPAPELYLPLTGPNRWRFGTDHPWLMRHAGEMVWNEPNAVHATLVDETPLLCLYAWTADVHLPARVIPADDWPAIETALVTTRHQRFHEIAPSATRCL